MPGALIYVPEPLHLQLLSIRLYNISLIVQLPALSSLPRPVSKTCPTHNHSGSSRGGVVRGCVTDRIEQEIEEVGYNRYEEGRESKSAGLKREIEKWQAEMGGGGRNARQRWDDSKKRGCMLRGVWN